MFTGIIGHVGIFKGFRQGKKEMTVASTGVSPKIDIGDSLAVNGVCLSLVRKEKDVLVFNLSKETLEKTTLGGLRPGVKLNLELPLTLQSLLSGHLMSGHVDATGRILSVVRRSPGIRLTISFPPGLRPYLIPKGSVGVNGVSLTVAVLTESSFAVELIPLTLESTALNGLKPGDRVNLECDILGKYVYNWLVRGKKGQAAD